jgi:Right handed beta helix region
VRSVTVVVARRGQGPPQGQGSGLRRRHAWNIGRQWYVDALNGSDRTGNGSAGSPWQSLQKAADYLRTRATWPRGQDVAVNIRPTAAYKAPATEQATLWTDFSSPVRAPASNRYLIWRVDPAYPGRARIVNPDGASGNKIGVILGSSRLNSYQVFSGLDVDGEQVAKGSGGGGVLGFYLSGTGADSNTRVEILDTKIHGFRITPTAGNSTQGMFADDGSSFLLLDQVEVYDIGPEFNAANRGHGLYLQGHDVQITNSIFHTTEGYGIQFYSAGAVASNGSVVANCTFNDNFSSGILVHPDSQNMAFINNIFSNHTRRGTGADWGIEFFPAGAGTGSGNVVDHNVYYNNTNRSRKPAGWRISNEQTADPRYANAAAGDLHLLTGSPALGYTDTVFSPAVDYDGTPRPAGAEDAGAYERAGG